MAARTTSHRALLTAILVLAGAGCGGADPSASTLEVRRAVIDGAMLGEVVDGLPLEITAVRELGSLEFRSADADAADPSAVFFSLTLCDSSAMFTTVDPYGSLQTGPDFACEPSLSLCEGERCATFADIDAEVIALGESNLVSVDAVDIGEPNGAVHVEIEYAESH